MEYTNLRRHARTSNVKVGDTVVDKRPLKEQKLASNFAPEEWKVVDKNGSDVTLSSKDSDHVIQRNSAHLKRLIPEDENVNPDPLNQELQGTMDKEPVRSETTETVDTTTQNGDQMRSRRPRKQPAYLNDFKVNSVDLF